MASEGGAFTLTPGQARGQRFLIVEARYYTDLANQLLEGAEAALKEAGADYDVVTVPGALEIPGAVVMALNEAPEKYAGFVALGCVIRGETTHYEIVSEESARALMDITLGGVALGNGILTVENMDQATDRARADKQNKGGGAAIAAIAMCDLKRKLGGAS